jgi:hypothetical protein
MTNLANYTQSPFNKSRKDKFLFVLNLPKCLKDISTKFDRSNEKVIPDSLQFSVYGIIVPTIEISPVNVRYSGQTLASSSYSREPYETVTVNFTIDNRFNNYWIIYKWLDILNNAKTGTFDKEDLITSTVVDKTNSANAEYLKYRANFSIFALDEYDKRTIEFKYINAFPTALGGIDFNNRDEGEIETNFSFNYSQLEVIMVTHTDSL